MVGIDKISNILFIRKLIAFFLILILVSTSFGVASAKEKDPNTFMKIEAISSSGNNEIFSLFRSSNLQSASYRITYSFYDDLDGEWRRFSNGSICLTTQPYATMNSYYNDKFFITLFRKTGWWSKNMWVHIQQE